MAGLHPETTEVESKRCPHCGSSDTRFTQRGYAGLTDAPDQYITCRDCGEVTYEIISRTERELRIDRIESGSTFKHDGNEYTVRRILRVGIDELLVYVQLAKTETR
ncbi:MAG: hypothetical protein ACOC9Y_02105 [Chloroflexota bacterium]